MLDRVYVRDMHQFVYGSTKFDEYSWTGLNEEKGLLGFVCKKSIHDKLIDGGRYTLYCESIRIIEAFEES